MTPFEQAESRAYKFALMSAVQASMEEIIELLKDCDNFINIYSDLKEADDIPEPIESLIIQAIKDQNYANDSLKEIAERVEKHFGISA